MEHLFGAGDEWYRPAVNLGTLPPAAERPTYTAAEAARYARTSPSTTRRWLKGYEYETRRGRRRSGPVAAHPAGQRFLTFYDLVEVAAIASAINAGVSLQRVRAAVAYAKELFDNDRPLLLERFLTDGRDLFLRELRVEGDLHINASQAGQTAFSYIAEILRHLDYESERPVRWWPSGKDRPIAVDPRVSFGHPIILPQAIRTETVADSFEAGESIAAIAEEFELEPIQVEEAIRFENRVGVIPA